MGPFGSPINLGINGQPKQVLFSFSEGVNGEDRVPGKREPQKISLGRKYQGISVEQTSKSQDFLSWGGAKTSSKKRVRNKKKYHGIISTVIILILGKFYILIS